MNSQAKIRVAVLGGGISNEREVSLSTASQVMDNLDKEKFQPVFYDTKTDLLKLFADAQKNQVDVAFIALHGKGGEDGTIQGMLELLDVPYIGPGVLASAIGMDKIVSKQLFEKAGITMPKTFEVHNAQFPCVVKPNVGGSSIGISLVNNTQEFDQAVSVAFSQDKDILIEEYILGTEITVGVLGNKELQVLPVVEICPKNKFFDYQAKYDAEYCNEIVPARISEESARQAQELAKKVYRLLGCKGFSRIDMILRQGTGEPVVLEINTIPGLTPNSLLPKAAEAAGISFSQLLEKVIMFALEKEETKIENA